MTQSDILRFALKNTVICDFFSLSCSLACDNEKLIFFLVKSWKLSLSFVEIVDESMWSWDKFFYES